MNSWLVVVTFFFLSQGHAEYSTRTCPTWACVEDTMQRAEADPAVIHYQVLEDGDWQVKVSHFPVFRPKIERWKQ